MTQPRNRWIVNIVLAIAVLAFVGVSMVPIIAAFRDTQNSNQNPDNSQGTTNNTASQKVKLQEEIRGLELVLQREPENQATLKSLLERRLQLLSLGEGSVRNVIEPLEKLSKLNPEQTNYAILLAQAKQQIGDKEGAAQAYRSVLTVKPGDIKALQGMVTLLLAQKRPEAAIGLLEETLSKAPQVNKIEPGSVDIIAVQILLGNVYATQKNFAKALSTYDTASKFDVQDFRPVLAKAITLKGQGKIEDAKPVFAKAASLAPAKYKDEINKQATTTSKAE
ncbi:tetratricopeptide repeat protein [Calothrix sp. 336/3]|uniref:tetratricopeptide repeat protein n=1 Tax=Calothrix sp. 336/3 TaxID=1337936 RepID=UPI0004E353CC|nr:tetratricopeptide repeat protein [Calothrix sp. 336/3]AKG23877.1 Tfp pilus assembly protein PilF [Calothrix sp. 336/3]